jgi:1-deoxy-D-xylulose-5-phosphate synthase
VPNLSLLTPADENECRMALTTAFRRNHPVAVRYPRGVGIGARVEAGLVELPWGKGELRRRGHRIAILAFGTLLYPALDAADRLDATVANMRFAKPLDVDLVLELARGHEAIVTIEEGCIAGGAGSAVTQALHEAGLATPVLALGLPDEFVEHGDPAKLLAEYGLDAAGIEQSVRKRFGARPALVAAPMRPAVNS